jgi:anti-sigma-K factor RskA
VPAADAFAITVEPTAGSAQPTSPIILVGKVRKG